MIVSGAFSCQIAGKKERLPFPIQEKQFGSERIPLDARNTGIKKDISPERVAQIKKCNKIFGTIIPLDVYTLKPFTLPVDSKRITSGFGERLCL